MCKNECVTVKNSSLNSVFRKGAKHLWVHIPTVLFNTIILRSAQNVPLQRVWDFIAQKCTLLCSNAVFLSLLLLVAYLGYLSFFGVLYNLSRELKFIIRIHLFVNNAIYCMSIRHKMIAKGKDDVLIQVSV
jgi:hypothetical protein